MRDDKICPRCQSPLQVRQVTLASTRQQVEIDRCSVCQGMWFDRGELSSLIVQLEPAPNATSATGLPCPTCHAPLMRGTYRGTRVAIDHCASCAGTWLDAGEFKAIRESVRKQVMSCECGKQYRVGAADFGKEMTCRRCDQTLRVTKSGLVTELPTVFDDLLAAAIDGAEVIPSTSKSLAPVEAQESLPAKPTSEERRRHWELDLVALFKGVGLLAVIVYLGFLAWYLVLPVEQTATCDHKQWRVTVQIERLGKPHWSRSKRDVWLGEERDEVKRSYDSVRKQRTSRSVKLYKVRTYEPIRGERFEFSGEDDVPQAGTVRPLKQEERITQNTQYFVTFAGNWDTYSKSIYTAVTPGKSYVVTTNRENKKRVRSVVSEVD